MSAKAFEKIAAGLRDAIAFAQGDETKARITLHCPECGHEAIARDGVIKCTRCSRAALEDSHAE